jgi:hypothetical protein
VLAILLMACPVADLLPTLVWQPPQLYAADVLLQIMLMLSPKDPV